MEALLARLAENFKTLSISLTEKKSFLLLVSGGPDSIFLLHAMHSLIQGQEQSPSSYEKEKKSKGKKSLQLLRVLHVNYQLRGQESDNDALLVEKTCEHLNVPMDVIRHPLKIANIHRKDKSHLKKSYEQEAREVRYQLAFEIKNKRNLDYILTAHHQDDEVETFLLKLFQSGGVDGLTAFSMQTRFVSEHDSSIILRPLLNVTKASMLEALRINNISYASDSSNAINHCLRNAIRNEVVPRIDLYDPSWQKKILMSKRHLKREGLLLKALAKKGNYLEKLAEDFYLLQRSFFDFDKDERVSLLKILLSVYFKNKQFSFAEVGEITKKINDAYHQNNGEEKKLFRLKSSSSVFYVYQHGMIYPLVDGQFASPDELYTRVELGTSCTIANRTVWFDVKHKMPLRQRQPEKKELARDKLWIEFSLPWKCQTMVLRRMVANDVICLDAGTGVRNRPVKIKKILQAFKIPRPVRESLIVLEAWPEKILLGMVFLKTEWLAHLKASGWVEDKVSNVWLANHKKQNDHHKPVERSSPHEYGLLID